MLEGRTFLDPGVPVRRRIPLALAITLALTAVPGVAAAKGGTSGGTAGGGSGGGTAPCVAISLPKPVESFNVAGKTDLTVRLQTKVASCTARAFVIDIVEIDGPDPATANPGSPYPGCAFSPFSIDTGTITAGSTRTIAWDTPPLTQVHCTHWLEEILRDPRTGETWGPVVQRLDHTSRI
jgi:hypothetical protein